MTRRQEDANSRWDADRIANSADAAVYKMSVAGCKSSGARGAAACEGTQEEECSPASGLRRGKREAAPSESAGK
jgi:hypothetical protein